MNPILEKTLLVTLSICLALYLHLGFYQRPAGMVDASQSTKSPSGELYTTQEPVTIQGIQQTIDFTKPDQGMGQIDALWDAFFSNTILQNSVDRSESQTAIAYYDDFSEDGTLGNLTLAYSATRFHNDSQFVRVSMAPGQYQLLLPASPTMDALSNAWQTIFANEQTPLAVIERYALDTMGQPQEIQLQVLYP